MVMTTSSEDHKPDAHRPDARWRDVSWTLRSLVAAGMLAVCIVASAYSGTVSAHRADKAAAADRAHAAEAALVADFADFLAAETETARTLIATPRLKPAKSVETLLAENAAADALTAFDLSELTAAKLDAEERECMAQAIYYEARSEPRIGQLAVADVVLNRVRSTAYPNSICEVVFQGSERRTGCQFSFTCDGSMDAKLNKRKWKSSEDLAGAVLAGVRIPVSRNATHYHADYVDPYWADTLAPTAVIGVHKFYKFKSKRTVASAR